MTALSIDPRRDYPTISLVGLAHGTSHFFHLLLPTLFPWLMPEFGLNFTQAGALMTVFFVVSGIGQALSGIIVDRLGAARVLYAGLLMLSCAALLVGSAQNYPMLMMGAALAGLGNSVFHPADYTILNRRVSSARLGQAFSAHGLAGNAGWVLAPPVLVTLASLGGWRVAAYGAALLGCASLAVLVQARRLIAVDASATVTATPSSRAGAPGRAGTASFLRLPAVWLCFGFFLCTSAAFGTLQNFAGPLLGHLYGMAPALAASCLTAYLIGSTCGTAAGGVYAKADRAHDRTIAWALSASAFAAALLATGHVPGVMVLPLLATMGFGVGFTGPSRDLMVRKAATAQLGEAMLGRVYGFVYSGLDSGLALAPLLFGPWMDRGAFSAVLVGVAVLQVAAVFATRQVGQVARAA